MTQSFKLPLGQAWFIDRMKTLYQNTNHRGVCYGIAYMGLQAFFANDIYSFNRRLYYINQISVQKFNVDIRLLIEKRLSIIKKVKSQISPLSKEQKTQLEDEPSVKAALDHLQQTIEQLIHENKIPQANRLTEYEKRKATLLENFYLQKEIEAAKLKLDERERLSIDIPIFLEGVELNQIGYYYEELFESGTAPTHQKGNATLPLTQPKSIEEQGGITPLTCFTGLYNENELNIYFHTLAKALAGTNTSIAIELCNSDHTITVCYDAKNSNWVFIDANQLPAKENVDRKELAELVKKALSSNNNCIFSSTIYAKNSEKNRINQSVATWQSHQFMQRIHTVTEEKAKTFDSDWVNWLYIASKAGDLAAVDKLLQLGADPNFTGVDSHAPLAIATQHGHTRIVTKLIEKGAIINQADKNGTTALKRAVQNGYLECIQELLKKGASRFIANNRIETVFLIAAANGRIDILKELLKTNGIGEVSLKNSWINIQSFGGLTPLLAALKNDHTEIAKILILENVDVNIAGPSQTTPLSIAVKKQNLELVNALLQKGAKPNVAMNDGTTPLFIAAENGNLEMVITLLNHGADPNQVSNHNVTPLFIAAQNGRWDIVKALLAKGADCNMPYNNTTPLLIATKNKHIKTMQVLLDHGADVNKQYSDGATPLLIATQNESLDAIKILLEKGAEVDKGTANATPLVRAILQGRLDLVQILLDSGANPNQPIANGDTPGFLAFKKGRKDIYDALLKKGMDRAKEEKKLVRIQEAVKELFPNSTEREFLAWVKNYKSFLLLQQFKATSGVELIHYDENELKLILDFFTTYLQSTPLNEAAKLDLLKYEQLLEVLFLKKKIESSEIRALFSAVFNENDAKDYEKKRAEVFQLIHKHNPIKQKNIKLMFEEFMSNRQYEDALKILNLTDFCLLEDVSESTLEDFMDYTLSSRDNPICEALFSQTGRWLTLDEIYSYIHGMKSSEQYMVQALKLALIVLESPEDQANFFADIFCDYPNFDHEKGLMLDNLLDLLTPTSFELLKKIVSHPSSSMPLDDIKLAEILLEVAKKSHFDKNKLKNIKNVLEPILERDYPPLILAIKEGNLSRVYELLETTDPNLKFKDDVTPLYYATQLGKVDIMRALLEKGANVNATKKNGMTPLFAAASKRNFDAFLLLLDYEANPNAKRHDGLTPIFMVLQKKSLDILSLLLSKNRDIQQAIEDGYHPLAMPIDLNQTINDSGVTPLYAAIEIGDIEMIQTLLNTGADPNKEVYDRALLFKAIELGRLDIVEALLDAKADPNKEVFHLDPAKEDQTPITFAIRNNQLDILDALLKRNADPNKAQYNGKTPLEIALESKNVNALKRLLNENIDNVDVKLTTGLTALQTAVYAGQIDIVNMLLDKQASPYISGPDGATALFYAAMQGHVEIIKSILSTIDYDESQHAIKISAEKLRSFVKKHDLVMFDDDLEKFIKSKNSSQTFFSPEFYVTPSEIANLTGDMNVRNLFNLSKTDQRKRKVSSNEETFQPNKIIKGGM